MGGALEQRRLGRDPAEAEGSLVASGDLHVFTPARRTVRFLSAEEVGTNRPPPPPVVLAVSTHRN
jgi:hypothetical protein